MTVSECRGRSRHQAKADAPKKRSSSVKSKYPGMFITELADNIPSSDSHPLAKTHARKVAKELNISDGLVFLPGEPSRTYENSDMSPPFRQRR